MLISSKFIGSQITLLASSSDLITLLSAPTAVSKLMILFKPDGGGVTIKGTLKFTEKAVP
ncbi:hypothetical protein D3C85_1456430 [compost metagenome]